MRRIRNSLILILIGLFTNNQIYPDDYIFDSMAREAFHINSLIWSGALWDLKQAVGSMVTDFTTLKSLYYMDENADFIDAYYALRWANLTYFGGWHISTIQSVFANRGIPPGGSKISAPRTIQSKYLPDDYCLFQNYPNPFNPETTIRFYLPEESKVTIVIYNVQGKEVIKLINGCIMNKGFHTIKWNASNLSSGIYLVKVKSGKFTAIKKAVLVK